MGQFVLIGNSFVLWQRRRLNQKESAQLVRAIRITNTFRRPKPIGRETRGQLCATSSGAALFALVSPLPQRHKSAIKQLEQREASRWERAKNMRLFERREQVQSSESDANYEEANEHSPPEQRRAAGCVQAGEQLAPICWLSLSSIHFRRCGKRRPPSSHVYLSVCGAISLSGSRRRQS